MQTGKRQNVNSTGNQLQKTSSPLRLKERWPAGSSKKRGGSAGDSLSPPSIQYRTPLSKVWRLIRRLKGKGGGGNVQHLKLSDTVLTTTDEIAQTLAETFAHNSSSDNCLPQFIPIKHRQEKQNLLGNI